MDNELFITLAQAGSTGGAAGEVATGGGAVPKVWLQTADSAPSARTQAAPEPSYPWMAISLLVVGVCVLLVAAWWQRLRARFGRARGPQRPSLTSLNPTAISPTPTAATPAATRDEVLMERARHALRATPEEVQWARRVARQHNLPSAASVLLVPSLLRGGATAA
jgi:hypothetical protein